MKKSKIFYWAMVLVFVVTTSCETYDDYETNRSTVAGFTLANANIKVPNGGTRDKKVDIFISQASDVDRTLTVSVVPELTEAASENYTFNPTVLVPANTRVFEFTFTGIDVSLTDEGTPVTIEVVAQDGIISGGRFTALLFK